MHMIYAASSNDVALGSAWVSYTAASNDVTLDSAWVSYTVSSNDVTLDSAELKLFCLCTLWLPTGL